MAPVYFVYFYTPYCGVNHFRHSYLELKILKHIISHAIHSISEVLLRVLYLPQTARGCQYSARKPHVSFLFHNKDCTLPVDDVIKAWGCLYQSLKRVLLCEEKLCHEKIKWNVYGYAMPGYYYSLSITGASHIHWHPVTVRKKLAVDIFANHWYISHLFMWWAMYHTNIQQILSWTFTSHAYDLTFISRSEGDAAWVVTSQWLQFETVFQHL